MKQIIYLAFPYTHSSPAVRLRRFEDATNAAALLIAGGHVVYSPITMTHPIDLVLAGSGNTLGSDYWVAFDQAFMDACSEMIVVDVDGWQQSKGIAREIEYFRSQGKRVSIVPVEALSSYPRFASSHT